MKTLTLVVTIFLAISMHAQQNFHDFVVEDIQGEAFALSALKGKKVMVVNTASKCGHTPQYGKLEELYREFGGDNFVVIGFPANNFMGQEPGTNEEIAEFCSVNYGVTFPMMAKISVKGEDQHALYTWLTTGKLNGVEDSEVSWNFQKYLIDEEGNLVRSLSPRTDPLSEDVKAWLSN
jgi:glutathione peroxidase